MTSPASRSTARVTVEFRWQDALGLTGKEPFTLTVTGRDDEAPTLPARTCRGRRSCSTPRCSPSRSPPATISASSASAWSGKGPTRRPSRPRPRASSVLAAGGNDKEALDVGGTFSAKSLGIEPQPVNVRVFAEDYLPGRPRVYSPTYTFYVLNAEQHAIWVTEQLSKWHRQSLEVRDREMQLHETNKQLRALSAEELDRPETRRRIENQATAERANGRRLSAPGRLGRRPRPPGRAQPRDRRRAPGDMGRDAPDPQGHLGEPNALRRRPLEGGRAGADARLRRARPATAAPVAGRVRAGGRGAPAEPKKNATPTAVPQVVDRESSQNSPPDKPAGRPPPKGPRRRG